MLSGMLLDPYIWFWYHWLYINLIKIRSFDPLPKIATKGSNETPVQSREYLANQKTAYASA